MCPFVPRLPDGGSQIDKRVSFSCPVHHSHSGAEVQEPLPHGCRELPVQLLQKRPSAGKVRRPRLLGVACHAPFKALALKEDLAMQVEF